MTKKLQMPIPINEPPARFDIDKILPEILAEIGRIIAWWGYLQFQIGVIIRESTRLSKDVGFLVTIGPNLVDLCKAAKKITVSSHWVKDESIRSDLRILLGDIQRAAETRNAYAHGVFGFQKGTQDVFVRYFLDAKPECVSLSEEVLTIESLRKVSDQARGLWSRAQDITHRLKARR
jgi:hypothetical protein